MQFDPPLVQGTLLRRYKRFLADIELPDGRIVVAHCPNPGSMKSCAEPGWGARLSPANSPKRKLKWTLEIVEAETTPILVNTARPNHIVREAIAHGRIEPLREYEHVRSEVKYGENSRIDLLLESENRPSCFVEIKNVTLLVDGNTVAFPDSVSKRAAKHMRELAAMVQSGQRAVVFFLVSRTDATQMRPADEIDPAYGTALREAVNAGVEAMAYQLEFSDDGVEVGQPIPLVL